MVPFGLTNESEWTLFQSHAGVSEESGERDDAAGGASPGCAGLAVMMIVLFIVLFQKQTELGQRDGRGAWREPRLGIQSCK